MLTQNPPPQQQQIPLQVKYEDMTARYANHVLLNTGQEELYLDFSSGIVTDRGAGVSVVGEEQEQRPFANFRGPPPS